MFLELINSIALTIVKNVVYWIYKEGHHSNVAEPPWVFIKAYAKDQIA